MSLISMMESRMPPGFRFHPRDEELVLDYLCRKLSGEGGGGGCGTYGGIAMVDVDLNKCEPWELPGEACVGGREWYFFSLHDRKYATGQRTNRATRSGYWKATGKDRPIYTRRRPGVVSAVGMRKTLVFYQGRAPRGTKTEWVMHEFRVDGPAVAVVAARPGSPPKEDWVLCRAFYKSRTVVTRPAAAADDDEALSLSGDLIGMPLPHEPHAAAAFEHASAASAAGYYHDQDAGLHAAAQHHLSAALPFQSLSSFRDLLSNMVDGDHGDVAKAELQQGWTEAAYAQQISGSEPLTWNTF